MKYVLPEEMLMHTQSVIWQDTEQQFCQLAQKTQTLTTLKHCYEPSSSIKLFVQALEYMELQCFKETMRSFSDSAKQQLKLSPSQEETKQT